MAFDISLVPPELIAAAESQALNFVYMRLGYTVTQAAAYVSESRSENPQFTLDETRADACGKFVHGSRDGELPVKLGDLVDVLKDEILATVGPMVDAAIAGGA